MEYTPVIIEEAVSETQISKRIHGADEDDDDDDYHQLLAEAARSSALSEYDHYLQISPPQHGEDVLEWWRQHQTIFPHLTRMEIHLLFPQTMQELNVNS
jgi:hypothetical protein